MWPRKSSTKNNQAFVSIFVASFRNELSSIGLLFITLLIIACECITESEKTGLFIDNQRINSRCVNFTNGFTHSLLDGEMFSPEYPGHYPNNTECFRVLVAPYGYVIRLEFREHFDVEPSTNCQHDNLQIRDGAHGYSRLIGQFCGHTFPGELTSSDRYLWMRFVSDDTIEYGGFRIVYKFIPNNAIDRPELQPCFFKLNGNEGVFGTDDISMERFNYSKTYQVPLNCIWEIEVQEHQQIYLNFLRYGLEHPNECELNFIDIFPDLKTSLKLKHFCGSAHETVTSQDHKLYILYYADTRASRGDFQVLFTAYRMNKGEPCLENVEIDCEDSTCIDASLRCNGKSNCKYKTDEENCEVITVNFLAAQQVQVILIVGIGLLLSILVPSCWKCYRKWKDEGEDSPSGEGGEASTQTSVGQRTVEGSLHEQHVMGVTGGGPYGGQTNSGVNVDDDEHGCYVPEVDLSVFEKRSNGGHAILQDDQLLAPFCSLHEPSLDSTLPFDSADPLIATAPPPPILPLIPLQLLRNTQNKNQRNGPRANSAFGTPARTSTPPLPPPPPPPTSHLYCTPPHDNYNNGFVDNNSSFNSDSDNNNSFLTFLPPPPTLEEVEESDAIFGLPPTAALSGGGGLRGGRSNRTNNPRQFKAEAVIEMNQRPRSFESTKSAPDVIGRV